MASVLGKNFSSILALCINIRLIANPRCRAVQAKYCAAGPHPSVRAASVANLTLDQRRADAFFRGVRHLGGEPSG
jgi:hypothetical protein